VTDHPATQGGSWPASRPSDDDGWGPATSVRAGGHKPRGVVKPPRPEVPRASRNPAASPSGTAAYGADPWTPAGPVSRRRTPAAASSARTDWASSPPERGLPWWGALLVLIAIAAVGGLIDSLSASSSRSGFNIGIVVASIVAVLVARRSHMFPVVIAPPIVYSAAAVLELYFRSAGLHNKRVVFDAAANYLVYGFPAIASATAAVLIIAGIRLIVRR